MKILLKLIRWILDTTGSIELSHRTNSKPIKSYRVSELTDNQVLERLDTQLKLHINKCLYEKNQITEEMFVKAKQIILTSKSKRDIICSKGQC